MKKILIFYFFLFTLTNVTYGKVPESNLGGKSGVSFVNASKIDVAENGPTPASDYLGVVTATFTGILALMAIVQRNDLKKSSEAQLRAYLSVSPSSKNQWEEERSKTKFVFNFEFKNHGKTPAVNVRYKSKIDILEKDILGEDFERIGDFGSGLPTISPEQEIPVKVWVTHYFGKEALGDVSSGRKKLYIFGVLKYDDVFGKEHMNQFCFHWVNDGTTVSLHATGGANKIS